MRFSRIILASLAPLIGISALMSPAGVGEPAREDVIVRLWHTVVQMVAAVPEADTGAVHSLPDASHLLAFLPATPSGSAPLFRIICCIGIFISPLLLTRRPQRLLLRC